MNKQAELKIMVRGAYDLQQLRIMMGNRIVAQFKAKLGQKPSEPEEDLDEAGKAILKDLRVRYRKITDGVKTFPRQSTFKGDELISTFTELCLLAQYIEMEEAEHKHFRRLESVLREFPIYTGWLADIRGIGPAMAGVIISGFDIHKARYASSLWKYAGLDTVDGEGRSRKAHHLVDVEYINKDGEAATKKSITFNPFVKTKLIGVLGSSFLRAGDNKYRTLYDQYKARLKQRPDCAELTPKHIHNRAIRYMVKIFLADLYEAWRKVEGLPVYDPYHVDKLGMRKHEG